MVIDTWQLIKPFKKGSISDYERDYRYIHGLQKLAGERSITICLIHQMKKEGTDDIFDGILGSTAHLGVVDSSWALEPPTRGRYRHASWGGALLSG